MLRVLVLSRKLPELIPIEAVCSKTQCPTPEDRVTPKAGILPLLARMIQTLCIHQFCSWEPLVKSKSSVWTRDRDVELSARPATRTQHSI